MNAKQRRTRRRYCARLHARKIKLPWGDGIAQIAQCTLHSAYIIWRGISVNYPGAWVSLRRLRLV